ncbi:MAG: 8-amino-7-oxononanoate synthase [Desulfobulbaceae bacterium]|nr:MAG: 8-amino-7-oxononanoate synthase [Desulfobulbaceae bacterium]
MTMELLREELEKMRASGMYRTLRPLSNRGAGTVDLGGSTMINLSSNDYLGLAGNLALIEEFYSLRTPFNTMDRYAPGTASSRLLTGDLHLSHQLEELIASLYGRESSLLFNSGYHANIGIIPALFNKHDLILSDKLNHASIHDGLQICRAEFKRFRHADYGHLESLLDAHRGNYRRVVLVSESVFSMDGDTADLLSLVDLKKRYDCLLYLDEAHSIGLYGTKGLGLAEQQHCIDDIDLLVGTFGKACGSVGAFLVCDGAVRDYLINRSRPLIYTTALPPVVLSWNHFIMGRLASMQPQRDKLKNSSLELRKELEKMGLKTGGSTNIIPVIIGPADRTVEGAKLLQEHGFYVLPVRPPTVPQGTSRFRLSLTADHDLGMLAPLPGLISSWLAGK